MWYTSSCWRRCSIKVFSYPRCAALWQMLPSNQLNQHTSCPSVSPSVMRNCSGGAASNHAASLVRFDWYTTSACLYSFLFYSQLDRIKESKKKKKSVIISRRNRAIGRRTELMGGIRPKSCKRRRSAVALLHNIRRRKPLKFFFSSSVPATELLLRKIARPNELGGKRAQRSFYVTWI